MIIIYKTEWLYLYHIWLIMKKTEKVYYTFNIYYCLSYIAKKNNYILLFFYFSLFWVLKLVII